MRNDPDMGSRGGRPGQGEPARAEVASERKSGYQGGQRGRARAGGAARLAHRQPPRSARTDMERRQFRAPRGIRDVLPDEIPAWRLLEETARRLASLRGYREIRPALLEEVELFTRSVGEVTDIVQKEMFTLQKGETALALRPEGTAGIVRAYLEAGYANSAPLQRLFHVGPMFRYERPQKGRERMFTQFDVEVLGSLDPRLDAEVIHLAATFFDALAMHP